MEKINIKDSINLYHLKATKFKTFAISFYFQRPLCEEEISLNALIPYILKQGSANYPDNETISKTLEGLYGGIFDCSVRKKGDSQLMGLSFEFVSPAFIREENYKEKVLDFVFDVVFNPITVDGAFKDEYVEREKQNQIDYIKGIINDKKEYASARCVEEMFKGEAYALYSGGTVEGITAADKKSLYNQYKKLLCESPVDVFVSGDIDTDEIVSRLGKLERNNPHGRYPVFSAKKHSGDIRRISDKMNVSQGKLCMGFVTNVEDGTDEAVALTVFNSIFGSGAHSKLFNNVREKLSLCYYAASRLNKNKGTMVVSSGVEFRNFDKAYDEILVQLENMKQGKIEEWEMTAAKSALTGVLRSYSDNPVSTEEHYLNNALSGKTMTVEEFAEKINKVTLEEVVAVANKIELDTVYRLEGKE